MRMLSASCCTERSVTVRGDDQRTADMFSCLHSVPNDVEKRSEESTIPVRSTVVIDVSVPLTHSHVGFHRADSAQSPKPTFFNVLLKTPYAITSFSRSAALQGPFR